MTPDDSPTVTIRDVAIAAGVGVSTASRALGGTPTGARGRDAAADIRRIAAELGYVPHHAARALRGRRTSVVVLTDDPSRDTTRSVIEAMERLAREREDFFVSAAVIGPTERAQIETVRLVCSLRPLAIVISSTRLSNPTIAARAAEVLQEYRDAGGRTVAIGSTLLGGETVSIANGDAGLAIGRHVVALGRHRYGILAGDPERAVFSDRTLGFLQALDEVGVPRRDVRIEHGVHSRDGGGEAMARLLDGPERPDVVMAVNDLIAFGAMSAIRSAGLSIPGDIALSGIDNDPLCRDVVPPLTSYAFPFHDVGVRAAALALGDDGVAPSPVSGDLIARESTNPAASKP